MQLKITNKIACILVLLIIIISCLGIYLYYNVNNANIETLVNENDENMSIGTYINTISDTEGRVSRINDPDFIESSSFKSENLNLFICGNINQSSITSATSIWYKMIPTKPNPQPMGSSFVRKANSNQYINIGGVGRLTRFVNLLPDKKYVVTVGGGYFGSAATFGEYLWVQELSNLGPTKWNMAGRNWSMPGKSGVFNWKNARFSSDNRLPEGDSIADMGFYLNNNDIYVVASSNITGGVYFTSLSNPNWQVFNGLKGVPPGESSRGLISFGPFKDKPNRALPEFLGNVLFPRAAQERKRMIDQQGLKKIMLESGITNIGVAECAKRANDRKLKYFGMQDYQKPPEHSTAHGYSQCFAGNDLEKAMQYGTSDCDQKGGIWCNYIFQTPLDLKDRDNVAFDKLRVIGDMIYMRTFINANRNPGQFIMSRSVKTGLNNNKVFAIMQWPGVIGDFDIGGDFLYFINEKKINYVMKSGISQVFPEGTVVAYYLGSNGINSNLKTAITRNDFTALGVSNAIGLKVINNSLIILSNGSIQIGNLNEFNALNSLTSGFSLYSTPPNGTINFDCFDVGTNWVPLT